MKAAHALSSSFALVLALLVVGVPTQAQTVSSGPTQMTMGWQESAVNASLILFMRGYLTDDE